MTLSVLAAIAVCQVVTVTPCDRPADCGDRGVCVAGECRLGSARAVVERLATIAVPAPLLVDGDARLEARAASLTVASISVEREGKWPFPSAST